MGVLLTEASALYDLNRAGLLRDTTVYSGSGPLYSVKPHVKNTVKESVGLAGTTDHKRL